MIRKSDTQWWILEAKKHPESAPTIIEELAKRLIELDTENERLRDELFRLRRRPPVTSSGPSVQTLQRKVETLQELLDHEGRPDNSVVFISDQLRTAWMPLARAIQLASDRSPALTSSALLELRCLEMARSGDEFLLLTNQGRGFKMQAAEIERLPQGGDWPAEASRDLASGERLSAALTVRRSPRFWAVATRRGYIQRYVRAAFDRDLARGEQLISGPVRNDEPVSIASGDERDVMLLTQWGKGIRFSLRTVEPRGSIALDLDSDDQIVDMITFSGDVDVLILTASGRAMRRHSAQIKARARPGGKGKSLIRAHDVLAVLPYSPQARLLYLTYSGKLTLASLSEVPLQDRHGGGTQLCDLGGDPAISVALVT